MKTSTTPADEGELRDAATELEFAVSELKKAESYVAQVEARRAVIEAQQINLNQSLDPLDAGQVAALVRLRGEYGVLCAWLNNPKPVCDEVQHLVSLLYAAKSNIQGCAQARSPTENVISCCHWTQRLAGLEMKPLPNQLQNVKSITAEVLGGINTLLESRRPITLTPEEVREGIVQLGNGRGHRPLSMEERFAGFANE